MSIKKTYLYFFLFILLSSIVAWFLILAPFPKARSIFTNTNITVSNFLDEKYPSDLIINIKNGQVEINKPMPYCLTFDNKTEGGILFDRNLNTQYLFSDSSKSIYKDYCNPVAFVGSNFVVIPKEDGSYQLERLPKELSITVTKDILEQTVDAALPEIIKIGKIIYYLSPLLGSIFSFSLILTMNLWYAFIAKLVLKITKIEKDLEFKEAYRKSLIVLFALTIINYVIVKFLFNFLLKMNLSLSFPFFYTLLITLIVILLEKYPLKWSPFAGIYYNKRGEKLLASDPQTDSKL